jgi:hypothetical protein
MEQAVPWAGAAAGHPAAGVTHHQNVSEAQVALLTHEQQSLP